MNYEEARAFIAEISLKGSILGLETVTNLMHQLGDPQDDLRFIHVAGTNGKGSVLAYLAEVLKHAGYKAGRYISPTLFSYRERIQINGTYISREAFAALTSKVAAAYRKMEAAGMPLPTVFEVETAISFLYFKEQQCDFVLLEVGMGGRTDATNIIKTPAVTVLASISMDHMEFLGNTIGEIAWNKAGIFKEGVPAVSAWQPEEAVNVIRKEAEEKHTTCTFVDKSSISELSSSLFEQHFSYKEFAHMVIHLAGQHQLENASLALECIKKLREQGVTISDEAVAAGLSATQWKGRLTQIGEKPTIIIDGAHNPDAAMRLRAAVEKYFADKRKYYIFGVFSDKEYDKIIAIMADLATHIYAVQTPDNPRALPAEALAEAVKKVNPSVEACDSIEDAVNKCLGCAHEEDVVISFGSLSFLKDIENAVNQYKSAKNDGKDK